ncbi:hypothetical protein EYZ11_001640 [Aspergillus tanneri]|uniref:Uncharacterized protein n=1 Tax=Aspergillus tanneri TaxID=1220188 RepID=A0A4S3JST7_9EURO|nr:hypothetical protein EYZ11_001640 [Aspergillus tanneri]
MSVSSESSYVEVESHKNEQSQPPQHTEQNGLQEPIAIVGLGCRLPGDISSLDDFWDMLINGRTGQCDIPTSRFNAEAFYHPDKDRPGSMNTKGGYFLNENIRDFENAFFGINNLEATYMDPQQRKLLEVVYECFESAGARLEDVAGSNTGVYVGNFTMDFQVMQTRDPEYLHRYSATGMGTTILSNRVSHVFNLVGPSLVLDTACSSSLYCLHTAVMALRNHECDAAVAAGVNLIQSPEQHIGTMKAGVLSKTSTCHTFSDQADGYGRADGVGAVYVKRLSDAIANKDPIRAVIRGTAVNANGRTPGITQPSSAGQAAVICKAHAQAGLSLQDTSYVEAHGTGTPVGDPIEIRALADAFSGRPKASPLLVGSVKSNLGHSEAASGISSIIKAVLALERGVIPPTVNIGTMNPDIKTYDWNVEIVTRNTPWPCDGWNIPRRAGINSFGYGGANVHIVLEASDIFVPAGYSKNSVSTEVLNLINKKFLLPFSASSQSALIARVSTLHDKTVNLVDLAYTLTARRSKLAHKGFLVASQRTLAEDLKPENLIIPRETGIDVSKGFTFVFTGQGAQWAEMGKGLIEQYAAFRSSIQRYDAVLKCLKHGPSWTLIDTLAQPANTSKINEVSRAQTACTAIQIAIVELLSGWGIEPSAVIGHSSGEIAAAYTAGFLTSREAITIAYYRGYAVSKLSIKGQMMAVGFSQTEAEEEIERNGLTGKVTVACVNSPENVTLSGDADAIDALHSAMADSSVLRRKLLTDGRAYHSHHMMQVGAENKAHVEWISSVFVTPNTDSIDYSYWRHNLEKPVLFGPTLQKLTDTRSAPLIEIGPHGALKLPIKQTLQQVGITPTYFQALTRGESSDLSLLKLLGSLHVAGANVPLNIINGLDSVAAAKDISIVGKTVKDLPTYQWTYEQTLWNESRASIEFRNRAYQRHELLGSMITGGNLMDFSWRNALNANDVRWIQDHKLDRTVVFPAAGYIAMAIEALTQALGRKQTDGLSYELRNVNIMAALTLSNQDNMVPVELFTTLRKRNISPTVKSKKWWEFQISSVKNGRSATHVLGSIANHVPHAPLAAAVKLQEAHSEPSAVRNWYQKMGDEGLNFGDQFQTMKTLRVPRGRTERWAISEIDVQQSTPGGVEQDSKYTIHPVSIDGMFQTAIIAGAHGVIPDLLAQVPVSFESAIIRAPTAADLTSSYTVYANSHATSFSTATISTELRKPDGQVHAQFHGMRLRTYEGAASNADIVERQPMLRVCWKPDLASLKTAPDALEEYLMREAALEKLSAQVCPSEKLYQVLGVVELFCHKNPRAKLLYLLTDPHDLTAVGVCMKRLGVGTQMPTYSSFSVAEITDEGVVNRRKLLDASPPSKLDSLPVDGTASTYDIVIMPQAYQDQRKEQFHLLPSLIGPNGLLIIPDTLQSLPKLPTETEHSTTWEATNICGLGLLQKRTQDPKTGAQIENLVVVEDRAGTPLGDAILSTISSIADCVSRLPLDAVSESTIPPKCTVVTTIETNQPFLSTMYEHRMTQLKIITNRASNVIWVNTCGMLQGKNPDMALVGGLSRSLMLEQPSLSFYTLDMDGKTTFDVTARHIAFILYQSVLSPTIDYEFVESNGLLYISRFLPDYASNERFQQTQGKHTVQMELQEAGDCSLFLQGASQVHSLCFRQISGRPQLKDDAVEVEAIAHAVNAADSQVVHGKAETKQSTCATAFTGIVKSVGRAVTDLAPGDRVAVMAPNQFRLIDQVPSWACRKLESTESPVELATIFVPYATALYALHDRAHIQAGEKLLVHIDSSGIGLAATRLAALAGVEVFCTVLSTEAQEFLVKSYGMDEKRVFLLDESSYLADIFEATDGRGVDVVFNLLGGDLLHDSWRACADFGRFVEIGNRTAEGLDMNFFAKQLTYTAFDLEHLYYSGNPAVKRKWSSLVQNVLELYREGCIPFIKPLKVFDISEISEAYHYASAENRLGGVAVTLENRRSKIDVLPLKYATQLSPEKTYFLVGCLGGLGASLAKWMFARGARKYVFLGRSGADRPAARRLVEDLQSLGAAVSVVRGDVGSMADVQRAIDGIEGTLGGVVQAAMGLSEALFTTMTNKAWHTGIGPKLRGSWHLHQAIAAREKTHPLDFFLMTSSVSGSVGTATESNYCAANHFLDAFARYRRAQNLTATSLGLGMISEVGYLHENPEIEELLLRKGIQPINEEELLQIVDVALSQNASTPGFLRADPLASSHILTGLEPLALKGLRNKGFDVSNPILSDPRASLLATTIDGLASGDDSLGAVGAISAELAQALGEAGENAPLRNTVAALVGKRFGNLILIPEEKLDVKQPLSTYGMDSMLAAEFRSWVYKVFKADVPFLDLLSPTTSLDSLIDGVEKEVIGLLG